MDDAAAGPAGWHHAAAILTIAALCLVVYSNTLQVPFVFDDHSNILENRSIRWIRLGWSELAETARGRVNTARPVAYASFGLNHYWGGYEVRGFHVVNIAVHLLNAGLVYALALATLARVPPLGSQRLRPSVSYWIAASAALVFVSHPVQTQAVTYVVQRMTSLCVFFYLAALLLYVLGRTAATPRRRWALFAGGLLCWGLALGSKEIAATLPLAVLLYEGFFFRDLDGRWLRQNAGVGALVLVLLAAVAWLYLGSEPLDRMLGGYATRDFTLGERLLTQPRVVMLYLSLLVLPLPSRLNLNHDVVASQSLLEPMTTLLSLAGILGLVGLAFVLAPRQRIVSFGLLWFFLHLVIESSVIPLEMVFEHRLYLPMVGVSLAGAWGLYALAGRGAVWPVGVATAVCLLLAVGTYQRNRVWRDPVTLWSDVVSKSPRHPRARMNLGVALAEVGRTDEAEKHLREAVGLKRDYAEARLNLSIALAGLGRSAEALTQLQEALRIQPDHAEAQFAYGNALQEQGRTDEAVKHFQEALRLQPDYAQAHFNWGNALQASGRPEEALAHYEDALRFKPDYLKAHLDWGNALKALGRFQESAAHYQEALRIDPDSVETHNNLAWLRATCPDAAARDGQQALAHARRAVQLAGEDNSAMLDSLSAAHAELGDFQQAVRWQEKAIRIAPDPWKEEFGRRLELYSSGKPFREEPLGQSSDQN